MTNKDDNIPLTPSPTQSPSILSDIDNDKIIDFNRRKNRMFTTVKRSIAGSGANSAVFNSTLSRFSSKDVERFLKQPVTFERELRELSNYIYNVNGIYRSLIEFFALLPKYNYTVEPFVVPDKINKEKYRKSYFKAIKEIEKMNLNHQMLKVMKIAFKEDVFFGYAVETKDTFFIMHLPADYCRITTLNPEDGLYDFEFDFSYFDIYKDIIDTYPDEFIMYYELYKNGGNRYRSFNKQRAICLKVNEELRYPLIPFATIFESIFDLDDYKKIKKQKTKMDNFLLLTQKIPQGNKGTLNDFLIDLDLAGDFHDLLAGSVPDGISVALSPMDITATRMEKSKNDNDTIAQAQKDIYTDAGITQQMFNPEKSSAAGINKSITIAEDIVFAVVRQLEVWINRRLSKLAGQYKYHIKFLDITNFNMKEKQDQLHKAASSSLPMVTEYASSLGMSPLDLYNKAILENEVLGLHDLLRPLQTSYTQTSKDSENDGAPTKDDDSVAASTEVWRESDVAQDEV